MTDPLLDTNLKTLLEEGRSRVRERHRAGAGGREIVVALSELCDGVVGAVCRQCLESLNAEDARRVREELAIVAVGGYGRKDLSPYSDVDLLFLHAPGWSAAGQQVTSQLIRTMWDIGLKLSQSVRTPADCQDFARSDLTARTALAEARLVTGPDSLFNEFVRRNGRTAGVRDLNRFLNEAVNERTKEHQDYFVATVYLLEPNVKKSPGGLRDIHLVRWLGRSRFGTSELEALLRAGHLAEADYRILSESGDFLLRVRNELHFHAGTAQDVLNHDEQLRLAAWLGFQDQAQLLAVEQFMRHYYRHTSAVHDVMLRFVERLKARSWIRTNLSRLIAQRVEQHFWIDPEKITIDAGSEATVLADAGLMLELFDLARGRSVAVGHETLERIRTVSAQCPVAPAARDRFLRVLDDPPGLGTLLRNLHRVGLLSQFLPAFEHARCLIQFNLYHNYTVDEHSIRAIEAATRRIDDDGPLGQAYRQIHRKGLLHLALLVHDLGKGLGEDHSEVGRQIAAEVAADFGLSEHDRDVLVFLVHKHLLMSTIAFRRDTTDVATIVQFARTVGTPEMLRMLYVLTAADVEAVAPGIWTAWQESLLTELYAATMQELAGEVPVGDEQARAAAIRESLRNELQDRFPSEWLTAELDAFPLSYLLTNDAPAIAEHLRVLQRFDPRGVFVASQYSSETGLCRYTVFTHDAPKPGLFARIAGTLAASRFSIMSARLVTRSDGVVLDTFVGRDLDYLQEPPPERHREITERIERVLSGQATVEALLARRGSAGTRPGSPLPGPPPQVLIDNDSSDRFTIIEVFADDRLGLLYTIARTLVELGLSVHSAKISTRLDQIADAFYVTTEAGGKVVGESRIQEVQGRLIEAIRGLETHA